MSKPLRVFVGALGAEVNTFSPLLINEDRFAECCLFRAGEIETDATVPLIAAPLRKLRELQGAEGLKIIQGLCAGAQPGGFVSKSTYESLRDELLNDLQSSMPVDIAIFGLHGATAAIGYDDCDGDILKRARAIVGENTILSALLDPHCHLTKDMLENTDLLISYKEYPHTDIYEQGDRLVELSIQQARGEITPQKAAAHCGTVQIIHTTKEPASAIVSRLRTEMEKSQILDISIGHGFPWGDTADTGTTVWVTTDKEPELAKQVAHSFAEDVVAMGEKSRSPLASAAEAVEEIKAVSKGLVVVADSADNPGGGAPSDSTFLYTAMKSAGVRGVAVGLVWDPIAVSLCQAAGEGSQLSLRVGGKVSRMSGQPLDLDVRVGKMVENASQSFAGGVWAVGDAVAIHAGDDAFILTSVRAQCFDPGLFDNLGVDVRKKRVVIVKSSQHFYAAFAPLAHKVIYVEGEGALGDIRALPYEKIKRPIWPLDPLSDTQILPIGDGVFG